MNVTEGMVEMGKCPMEVEVIFGMGLAGVYSGQGAVVGQGEIL